MSETWKLRCLRLAFRELRLRGSKGAIDDSFARNSCFVHRSDVWNKYCAIVHQGEMFDCTIAELVVLNWAHHAIPRTLYIIVHCGHAEDRHR